MNKIIYSEEQLAIEAAAANTQDNLLIEAAAGAAKTTTLQLLAKKLRGSTLCLAFNKRIADEMTEKMPSSVDCRTLNSLGSRIWQQHLGRGRLNLFDGKCAKFLREFIDEQPEQEVRDHLNETYMDVQNAIKGSKNHGHVPDSIAEGLGSKCVPLLDDETFYDMLPDPLTDAQREAVHHVLCRSFNGALEGYIDYADQLLMPTVMRCMFPAYENILVDEAQDLSELNHVMLTKLVKRRIIAVGDSKQAIYAFRGAHTHGMPLLAERFKMKVMHLSTSYRCPQLICDHVRWHIPRIRHWEGNPNNPGAVNILTTWNFDDIPDGAAIICRTNAPLFNLAIRMIRSGRRPQVWGNDLAAGLVRNLETLGSGKMNRDDALIALQRWHKEKEAKLKRESAKANLEERVECLRVFIEDAETLAGAIVLASNVLNSKGKVDLLSGHKSKGHEWQEVFFLNRDQIKPGEQENNLVYVVATRSLHNLTYITSEGYSTL